MKPWFVGQKVCCIVDVKRWLAVAWPCGHFFFGNRTDPAVGGVYTIASINQNPFVKDVIALTLMEVSPDIAYTDTAFRPLVDSKNDISVFHEIVDKLNQQKEQERTDARRLIAQV